MVNRRFVTILYILAGLAGGVLVSSAATQVVAYNDLANPEVVGIFPLTTLLGLLGAAVTFVALWKNTRATEFVDSAVTELGQVTWPTRDETMSNTGIVVGAAVGFGALMFVYDSAWSLLTKLALYSNVGN